MPRRRNDKRPNSGDPRGQSTLASQQLDDELAQRYHQPRGVEQFGIEAVPAERRTVRWYDLFMIIFNFLLNPGNIVIGASAILAGLSFWAAVVSLTVGVAIAFVGYIAMATIGVDHGLPGQVATRFAYGIRGAKAVPSVLRTISSIYWFAFQTIAGALAIVAVLKQFTGTAYSLVLVSLIFAIIQVLVAVTGYQFVKHLSRVAFVLKIGITIVLLYVLLSEHAPSTVFGFGGDAGWSWALVAVWINAGAANWLSMITDAADFCRYSRTRTDMWVGTLLAATFGMLIAVFLGAYAIASAGGQTSNPFEALATGAAVWLLVLILIYVVFDNWTINVLNLYTGGLAVANILTRVGRFWTTLAVCVLGVGLSLYPPLVHNYQSYITILGDLFAPVAGVLIADYVFLRHLNVDVPALFDRNGRYWYWQGFNWVAIGWTAVGFVFSFFVPAQAIKVVATIVFTGVLYLATQLLLRPHLPTIQRATAPVEVATDLAHLDRRLHTSNPQDSSDPPTSGPA